MKTVVLDGFAMNPGDLSWSWLSELGEYEVYNKTLPEEIFERAGDADCIITNKVLFGKEELDRLPKLKYIGVTATGYNIIDTEYAAQKGIAVTNAPAYSTESVAQHTFALLLELMAHTGLHSDSVKSGDWASNDYFCYWKRPLTEISGKTMGIIGSGQIGTRVSEIARAFGMKTLLCGRTKKEGRATLDEVISESDVISLHCPQTDETMNLINSRTISQMRDGVYIINTARGGIVNECEVAAALESGKIAGYGADVISSEPPENDNPLIKASNTVITPHIAWASLDARSRLMNIVRENLTSFLEGKAKNRVN